MVNRLSVAATRLYTFKKPEVVIFVRHADSCPHRELETYTRCECVKWLRWSLKGKQHRRTAGTRSWSVAEEKRAALQSQLDTGESTPTQTAAPTPESVTIAQAVQNFLQAKEDENVSESTMRKLRYQLGLFEQFMTTRSKFYPIQITAQDVLNVHRGQRGRI